MNPFWILLDNQSTVILFYNAFFLQNIRKVDKELHLYTNAGISTINEVGGLPGFWTVWLHRDVIGNILSLHAVKSKGFQVDHNSANEDTFVITKKDGPTRKFTPSPNGLYYIDTVDEFQQGKTVWFAEEVEAHESSDHEHGTVLEGETVLEIKLKFFKQDVQNAELVRALQHVTGHLSNKQLLKIAQKNQLKNRPITPRDVKLMK